MSKEKNIILDKLSINKNKTDNFYAYEDLDKIEYKLDYNFYAFKEICFFMEVYTCPVDFRQIEAYYRQINNERRPDTFSTFINNTNEKQQSLKVSTTFLDNYIDEFSIFINKFSVVDYGVGEGNFSYNMAKYLNAKYTEVIYEGIDISPELIASTTSKFLTLELKDYKFIVGDIFGEDVDKLIKHPTLLIASQVVFYAKDISKFINQIITHMGAVAFVMGQSDHSYLNKMSLNYAQQHKQKNVETKVGDYLKAYTPEINSVNVLYSSYIDLPELEDLREVAYGCFDCFNDPKKLIARKLLEFSTGGTTLEYIQYNNKLEDFIANVSSHISRRSGKIYFWNFLRVIVPNEYNSQTQLERNVQFIYTQKLSGGYTELGNAILEANENIVRDILKSGVVITDIKQKHKVPFWKKILFYSRFAPILSMIEDKDISSNKTAFNLYINALKEEDYRVNNVLWEDVNNKLTQDNFIKIYDYLDSFIESFDQESNSANLFYNLIFRNIIGIISISFNRFLIRDGDAVFVDLKKTLICSTAMLYLSIYSYYTHYGTKYKLVHYLASQIETEVFIKLSPYDLFYNTFNIQSGSGKTALHYAAKSNSSFIAKQIMIHDFVRVDIADYRGYLPIHYAAENGNLELITQFLDDYAISVNTTVGGEVGRLKGFMNVLLLMFSSTIVRNIPAFSYGDFDLKNQWVADKIILDGFTYVIMGSDLAKRIYFGVPDKIAQIFFPHYTKEELRYENRGYHRYSKDSLLHLAIKNNHTDLSLWLINKNVSRSKNIDGIYPIHNAVASLNIELLQKLVELDPDSINYVAIREKGPLFSYQYRVLIYTHLTFTLERPYIFENTPHYMPHILNMLIQTAFWAVFSYEDSPFDQSEREFGSVLHFAASGPEDTSSVIKRIVNNKNVNNATILPEKDMIKKEILKFLIQQGADVDEPIAYQHYPFLGGVTLAFFLGNQFLIHQFNIHRFILPRFQNYLSANIYRYLESSLRPVMEFPARFRITYFHLNVATLLYCFFGRHTEQFKALDLVEKELSTHKSSNSQLSESYKLLKQYTSVKLNQDMSYSNHILSRLELISPIRLRPKNDTIYIKEYGTYASREEEGKFIISKNFVGKEENFRIILKNYQIANEIILDESFGIINISNIRYKTEVIMNKNSTILELETGEEIVTLYNYINNKIAIKPILSSFFSIYQQTWWDYIFGHNKIELNSSNNIYNSDIKYAHFKITKSELDNENIPSIINFDCKTKNQVLDFSDIKDVNRLEDLKLESINNTILVEHRVNGQKFVLLQDIDLYQLAGECFYFQIDNTNIEQDF